MRKTKNMIIFQKLFRDVLKGECTSRMNYSTLTPEEVAHLDNNESDYIEKWGIKRGFLKQHYDHVNRRPAGRIELIGGV